ncbi:MAG: MCE family protein, partial [Bacteroidia bacterium]|nr:MCE family protein [Bacteroidia bacterium]
VSADIYTSMLNLKSSLEKASALLEGLNKGKGSAGQFLTNDSLYTNLSGSLESLNVLLKDVKTNPKRYVHFSLFGKKNISPK